MFSLKDRHILITGASGGIGRAIATACHTQGAIVTLSGRNAENLRALADELGGARVHVLPKDLGQDDHVATLIPDAMEIMGGLDTLVNNAGITKDNLMMTMKISQWQDVLRMNLEVNFRLCQAALRPMLKAQFGRMINITSVVGVTGNAGQANYSASKAGLIAMSKSLAKEVASRSITVNCIAPGFIESPMTDVLTDDQKARITQGIPMGAIGKPLDIAAAVVYLASQEAGYVTGQTLHINGGMAMV